MVTPITVRIDSRLRLPSGLSRSLASALRKETTHTNPDFYKKKALGLNTFGTPSTIATWEMDHAGTPAESLSLPRGAIGSLRRVMAEHEDGAPLRFQDRRTLHELVEWPALRFTPRWYQDLAVEACMRREQGIVRAPTGSGKTIAALTLAKVASQPALVILRDGNLLEQWLDVAVSKAGLFEREVGILRGGKKLRVGPRLTLALQQTLYSPSFPLDEVSSRFGLVIVDECHEVAAVTFQRVISTFTARYRIGFSADEKRRDKKEFLVYDQLGEVIYEIERDVLEQDGSITPVEIVLVPTDFMADWYANAEPADRDFNMLLDEITNDSERNALLTRLVAHLSRTEAPSLVFSHRVAHASDIADRFLFDAGVRSGLLLGGDENRVRFSEDKARLKTGEVPVCVGTFKAVGQGIDMPAVMSGVMATPIGNNPQFFNQVRGRICRTHEGKRQGRLFVMWDRHVFPDLPSKFESWNGGKTSVMGIDQITR